MNVLKQWRIVGDGFGDEIGGTTSLMLISALELGFAFAFGWLFFAFTEDMQNELIELIEYNKSPEKC